MGYGEGNEQTLDFRFGDRVAAIVYREGRGAARGDGESQLYPSVLGGVAERVFQQFGEQRAGKLCIEIEHIAGRRMIDNQTHAFVARQGRGGVFRAPQNHLDLDRGKNRLDFAAFQPGQIQNILDQMQQVPCRLVDVTGIAEIAVDRVGAEPLAADNLGEPDD